MRVFTKPSHQVSFRASLFLAALVLAPHWAAAQHYTGSTYGAGSGSKYGTYGQSTYGHGSASSGYNAAAPTTYDSAPTHYGSSGSGATNYGSSYGSGNYGSGSYGSGSHGSGNYGSGDYGYGSHGSGSYGSGNYGSGDYGSGSNSGSYGYPIVPPSNGGNNSAAAGADTATVYILDGGCQPGLPSLFATYPWGNGTCVTKTYTLPNGLRSPLNQWSPAWNTGNMARSFQVRPTFQFTVEWRLPRSTGGAYFDTVHGTPLCLSVTIEAGKDYWFSPYPTFSRRAPANSPYEYRYTVVTPSPLSIEERVAKVTC